MRAPLPGFDPFNNAWATFAIGGIAAVEANDTVLPDPTDMSSQAAELRYVHRIEYERGGLQAVSESEAPLFMFAADLADPELVQRLRESHDLEETDLRYGVWPDSRPTTPRQEGEEPGVHLNAFGSRQVRLLEAALPEQLAIFALTTEVAQLVEEAVPSDREPYIMKAGRVPTLHQHVIAVEQASDGVIWPMNQRPEVDLATRQAARDRLSNVATPDRIAEIERRILGALGMSLPRN